MVSLDSASTPWLSWHLDSSLGEVGGHLSSTQRVADTHHHAEEGWDENVSARKMFFRNDARWLHRSFCCSAWGSHEASGTSWKGLRSPIYLITEHFRNFIFKMMCVRMDV